MATAREGKVTAIGPQQGSGVVDRGGRLRAAWHAVVAAIGTVVGLAPHVLHHIGLLAGTALVAGIGGTVAFGLLGFVVSIPFLLRLRRRFHFWWAPAIGLGVFVIMFGVSAFVVGPMISGPPEPAPITPTAPSATHSEHHR
jgi:hypothetical protein